MKTTIFKKEILFWFFLIFLISYSGTFSQNIGDSACISVNKIYLPFNREGVIADVNAYPGQYEVEFSAKGGSASGGNAYSLSSGIYFYKIQAGEFISVKKMILQK